MVKTASPAFPRFDTIPECDGQTDGQTDRQTDGRICRSIYSACKAMLCGALQNCNALLCYLTSHAQYQRCTGESFRQQQQKQQYMIAQALLVGIIDRVASQIQDDNTVPARSESTGCLLPSFIISAIKQAERDPVVTMSPETTAGWSGDVTTLNFTDLYENDTVNGTEIPNGEANAIVADNTVKIIYLVIGQSPLSCTVFDVPQSYAVVTCEIKLFQNYFSLRRRPSRIFCLKLFQT